MNMKLNMGKLGLDFGWFAGEKFVALQIEIIEPLPINGILIISIQIAKFMISIYWD
jgi:hypothetical protein